MKLGINSMFLAAFEFGEGLRIAQDLGAECIEIVSAESQANNYCNLDLLLGDKGELNRWLETIRGRGLTVSALAAHGDPLSPNPDVAKAYSERFRKICRLAEAISVDLLTLNSGLPEGSPGDKTPCWIVDPAAAGNRSVLRWQWEERIIPFWRDHAKIAQDHGLRLCVEPWFHNAVHSPATLMKLRDAVGPAIGCNFDPSHLFVQQIDVLESILYLGDALWHVHIKDTRFRPAKLGRLGTLDTTTLSTRPQDRPWSFTLVGWGHDDLFWRDFVANLQFIGYEGALSIEMEDDLFNMRDGLEKSFAYMKRLVLDVPPGPGERWWEYGGLDALGGE
jgi:sugar phosphate isomerase/epimerase